MKIHPSLKSFLGTHRWWCITAVFVVVLGSITGCHAGGGDHDMTAKLTELHVNNVEYYTWKWFNHHPRPH